MVTNEKGLIDKTKTLQLLQKEPVKRIGDPVESFEVTNSKRKASNTSYQSRRFFPGSQHLQSCKSNKQNLTLLKKDKSQQMGLAKGISGVPSSKASLKHNSSGNNSQHFKAQMLK